MNKNIMTCLTIFNYFRIRLKWASKLIMQINVSAIWVIKRRAQIDVLFRIKFEWAKSYHIEQFDSENASFIRPPKGHFRVVKSKMGYLFKSPSKIYFCIKLHMNDLEILHFSSLFNIISISLNKARFNAIGIFCFSSTLNYCNLAAVSLTRWFKCFSPFPKQIYELSTSRFSSVIKHQEI